jgi:hypothetical protein
MVVAFQDLAVDTKMLEKRLGGRKVETCSETELIGLRKIYMSLRDGMSKRDDWFGEQVPEKGSISMDQLKAGTPDPVPNEPEAKPEKPEKLKPQMIKEGQVPAKSTKKKAEPQEERPIALAEPDEPGAHDGEGEEDKDDLEV